MTCHLTLKADFIRFEIKLEASNFTVKTKEHFKKKTLLRAFLLTIKNIVLAFPQHFKM